MIGLKPCGEHPDDLVRNTAQGDRPAKNRSIAAKSPLPQAVADDRHPRCLRHIVFRTEITAEYRCDAEHAEVLVCDLLPGKRLRLGPPGQRRPPPTDHGDLFEEVLLSPPVHVIARGPPFVDGPVAAAEVLPDHDQPVRTGVGEWPQEQRVHDGEDGGVGADAQAPVSAPQRWRILAFAAAAASRSEDPGESSASEQHWPNVCPAGTRRKSLTGIDYT